MACSWGLGVGRKGPWNSTPGRSWDPHESAKSKGNYLLSISLGCLGLTQHLPQWASCALSPSNAVGGPASPPPLGPCSEAFGAPCRRSPAESGVGRALAFGSRSGEPGNLGAGTGQLYGKAGCQEPGLHGEPASVRFQTLFDTNMLMLPLKARQEERGLPCQGVTWVSGPGFLRQEMPGDLGCSRSEGSGELVCTEADCGSLL